MLPVLVLSVVYVVWSPPSADLAAQTFRTELFSEHGFAVWSNAWYGGLHLPAYSLLHPPLAAFLGIRLLGALSAIAATALFAALVRPRYGDRARLAIWLFGLGAGANLFTGRLTFALGLAIGLAALVEWERGRHLTTGVLAALASGASPVAGLFVAFVGGVVFLTGRPREGLALAAPALAVIGALALAFPGGGVEPFAANTFVLITAATLILFAVIPHSERVLSWGAFLYALFCLALFVIDTPVGGNATRLGALAAAPVLALGAWRRRPTALVVAALAPLLYWQWVAPVRDLSDAVGQPSVERSYYEPLLTELERRAPEDPFRVQIPPTRNRWEAMHVAEAVPLARGWMRQAESDDFELFQHGNLTAGAYREWLDERGVAFVAISADAEPDYLSRDEIELIRSGLSFLPRAWANGDWELYRVRDPAPLATPPARLLALEDEAFELRAPRPGEYRIAVRSSPYWRVAEGDACVSEAGEWTRVDMRAAGRVRVEAKFTADGFADALRGRRESCSPEAAR